jgi:hypothetical protein
MSTATLSRSTDTPVIPVASTFDTPATSQVIITPVRSNDISVDAITAPSLFVPSQATRDFLNVHNHLDYDVQLVKLTTTGEIIPDFYHRQVYPRIERQDLPSVVAVRRSDNGQIIGSVGGNNYLKYTPCQNSYFIESMYKAGCFDHSDVVEAESFKNGALVFVNMEARDEGLAMTCPKGVARMRMHYWNGHTGNRNLTVTPMIHMPQGGDIPMFTQKGVLKSISIRHTRSLLDTVDDLSGAWSETLTMASKATDALASMGKISITEDEFKAIILTSMNRTLDGTKTDLKTNADRFTQSLLEYRGNKTPETLFDLADAVAAHIDHERPVRKRAGMTMDEARRESALVGIGGRLKDCVLREALEMLNMHKPVINNP